MRGTPYQVEIGFVLKLARESLISKLNLASKKLDGILSHLSTSFGTLYCSTRSPKEYKILK